MITRFIVAVTVAACAGLLAGCGGESGTAIPSRDSSTSAPPSQAPTTGTSESGDRYGAPPIENPLDTSQQLTDPCSSLTTAQTKALGLLPEPAGSDTGPVDPSCAWRDLENRVDFNVSYLTANKNGLVDLYRGQQQGQWAYWEPTTVNGYPGAWFSAGDRRDRGYCTIGVGLNDHLHLSVSSRGAEPSRACDQVKDIAAAVVDTLKAGG